MIYDFGEEKSLDGWRVVDDGVMGGMSAGNFQRNDKGEGVFSGVVSLENNGGFSSLRYRFSRKEIGSATRMKIMLQGDGKNYQFRLKDELSSYHSYVYEFKTTGNKQEMIIPLKEMFPSFRGRRLKMSNFSGDHIEEIAFLISNKVAEKFKLRLSSIELLD
jgi:hypothetical protein